MNINNQEIIILTRRHFPIPVAFLMMLIPCLSCYYSDCKVQRKVQDMMDKYDKEWNNVIEKVSGMFQVYNIVVTPATELRVQHSTSGSKHNRRKVNTSTNMNVGLQFDIVHRPLQIDSIGGVKVISFI